jgi:hypothetical protein
MVRASGRQGSVLSLAFVSAWACACAAGSGDKGARASEVSAVMGDAAADAARPSQGARDPAPAARDAGTSPIPRDPNDRDEDGARGGVDCDDDDDTVYPGAPERCDGKDNDCDGFVDTFPVDGRTFYPDADGDGLGNAKTPVRACEVPAGWVTNGDDCDDADRDVGRQIGSEFCIEAARPVVYVAQHGHDDNAGDAPMRAVRTIQRGIERALACPEQPCSVLIAEGSYAESVSLADGVSLFGGYSADFTRRDATAHEVLVSSDAERTIVAAQLRSETRLSGLTLLGATLLGEQGRSSYALWADDCAEALLLQQVVVKAGAGEAGPKGNSGLPTSCDARGGQGGTSYDCGASEGGVGDASGDPVNGGAAGGGGSSNCPNACPLVGSDGVTAGTSGKPGRDGDDGAGGIAPEQALGAFEQGLWIGPPGGSGARGFHGTGGGGGGGGGTKRIRACFGCGTLFGGRGGDGAPGGCGGGGGEGGGAGGGAFAIAAIDSTVALEDVVLVGGRGGRGGPGGEGSDGQPGGQTTGLGHEDGRSKKCGAIRYYSGAGGIGGIGGAGGAGGGGAGGTGGAAITLLLAGSANVVERGSVELQEGVPGEGGAGGNGPGHAGTPGRQGAALSRHAF